MAFDFIERKIVLYLIVADDYIRKIRPEWDTKYIQSKVAKRLAIWCIEYFDKYGKAPGPDMEAIYFSKLRAGLPKDVAEEIEEDILPELNEMYLMESLNIDYILEQTYLYFKERYITLYVDNIKALMIEGELLKAETAALTFKRVDTTLSNSINLANVDSLTRIKKAFADAQDPLITFPGALGHFWNHQLVRGGFIALMGAEKRGKTFWMLEFAMRAVTQKKKVAFFQAGDMNESQQLRRLAIYLCRKSDQERYVGKQYEPVKDCIHNQLDTCQEPERECSFGPFPNQSKQYLRKKMTFDKLKEAYIDNPDYKNCYNCKKYQTNSWGVPWLTEVNVKGPLQMAEAEKTVKSFFIDKKRQFMLSTYSNGSLSVSTIMTVLANWEKSDNFIPDVLIIDYADLLVPENKTEYRHQQNEIWKGLRNISQEKHCLLITATQADAKSYDQGLLRLANFSEDKRKYAHVTAMYGLNQDPQGVEKQMGIMRINELVVRDGESSTKNIVHVLQNLRRGRPFLSSYY